MTDKIPISQVVVVEGKYDKIALSQILDAHIVVTDGFGVFRNKEKRTLLQKLGEAHGLIILTDSDGGGTQIRSTLAGLLPKEKLIHLYIPQIEGKERRKRTASKAGYLGVEGMDPDTLRRLFLPFSQKTPPVPRGREITSQDLYADGLLGGVGASDRRLALTKHLGLPPLMPRALLAALNLLYDYEGYRALLESVFPT